jgi:hypothetical protein
LDEAASVAARNAGLLIAAGVHVYSPIAHSHVIAMHTPLDPRDYGVWMPLNHAMMRVARGLIVLRMPGWATSEGVTMEREAFAGRRIVMMDPGVVPSALFT